MKDQKYIKSIKKTIRKLQQKIVAVIPVKNFFPGVKNVALKRK